MIDTASHLTVETGALGTENAGSLFKLFAQQGNVELDILRTNIINPEEKKKARTWGIAEASAMIGKSANTLRTHESHIPKDEGGKWLFTLDHINELREKYGTLYRRPEGSEPIIMAISNFKGGVAKTTTCVHLAQKAAIDGLRVLVVDLDPQASTTYNLGPFIPDIELGADDIINRALMEDPELIYDLVVKSYFPNISLVPSNLHLQELDIQLPNELPNDGGKLGHPAMRLKKALDLVKDNFDLILLDCGPNMASVAVNAMTACNSLLVPIPPASFDHASFVMLCSSLSGLFSAMNKKLDYLRILITKHPGAQSKGAMLVENRIRRMYGTFVLSNVMHTTTEIEKASSEMSTVYDQSPGRNNRRSYQRALDILDAVNNEILADIKQLWDEQAQKAAGGDA